MVEKIKCIYCIIDLILDKIVYVGVTKDFKQRKYIHFGNKKCDIDKYMAEQGRENFFVAILEELPDIISKEAILKKENEYIMKYDTIENGLNKNRSGLVSKNINEYSKKYSKTNKRKEYLKNYQNINKRKEYLKRKNKEYREEKKFKEYYNLLSLWNN